MRLTDLRPDMLVEYGTDGTRRQLLKIREVGARGCHAKVLMSGNYVLRHGAVHRYTVEQAALFWPASDLILRRYDDLKKKDKDKP